MSFQILGPLQLKPFELIRHLRHDARTGLIWVSLTSDANFQTPTHTTFFIISSKRIKLQSRAKSQIVGNSFAIPNLMSVGLSVRGSVSPSFRHAFFLIAEIDKKQHRIIGKVETLFFDCNNLQKKTLKQNFKTKF